MSGSSTRTSIHRLGAGLCAALLVGCSASASIELSAPSAAAEAEVKRTGDAQVRVRIVREGDKLTYPDAEIEFETASADLRSDTTAVIDGMAGVLRRYPELRVRIEGHTDSRGSAKANKSLSARRADSIKDALVDRGIAEARLDTTSFGEEQPERAEPPYCHNRAESKVPPERLDECRAIWADNRRAAFVVVEGADSLPSDGETVSEVEVASEAPRSRAAPSRRPDWALRVFTGYSTALLRRVDHHGGHLGVGLFPSQRFGRSHRGYIGGGPRLHYRGLRGHEWFADGEYALSIHQLGVEGDLLVGGGSERVVALFSLRMGLGVSILRGSEESGEVNRDAATLGGWLLGGVVVLAKVAPRWSVGGHAEVGTLGIPGAGFAAEIGVNAAWHFGIGRRYRLKI
ncbi:MAG: OmpA family protein [Nannocystaceae bacterium]